jgi:hypothetical protein
MLDLIFVNNASSFAVHVLASAVSNSMIIAFEIYIFSPKHSPRCGNFRFTAAILDFRLNGMSNIVRVSTVEKFEQKNMGVSAGILFLSALELEIHLGENSTSPMDNQRKYFILDIWRVKNELAVHKAREVASLIQKRIQDLVLRKWGNCFETDMRSAVLVHTSWHIQLCEHPKRDKICCLVMNIWRSFSAQRGWKGLFSFAVMPTSPRFAF